MAIEHLRQDDRLREVLASVDLPPLSADGDLYHGLLRAIIYQQLSGKAASTIYRRFLSMFPDEYPHAAELAGMDAGPLRAAGLSRQKLSYVQNVARFFMEGHLEGKSWNDWADEAIIQHLLQIKGVGRWTVQMLLMFTLERPDVFPVEDLSIQQAITRLYGLSENGKALRERMEVIAEPWRPYRSYACRYLWKWHSP